MAPKNNNWDGVERRKKSRRCAPKKTWYEWPVFNLRQVISFIAVVTVAATAWYDLKAEVRSNKEKNQSIEHSLNVYKEDIKNNLTDIKHSVNENGKQISYLIKLMIDDSRRTQGD